MAVSVDTAEQSKALGERLAADGKQLPFPLTCDPSRAGAKAFGVFDHEHDIALPSILILDAKGKVAWKYVGESVFDRPAEQELVATLERLRAKTPAAKTG